MDKEDLALMENKAMEMLESMSNEEFWNRFGQYNRVPFSLNYDFISHDLEHYLLYSILPKYLDLVSGHSIGHIMKVMQESVILAQEHKLRPDMCVVIACYHDIGLLNGREYHEKRSAEFMRNDKKLFRWFSKEEIEIMAQAVEDHRSSAGREPRSMYGKVVSEADRDLDPETVFWRYAETHKKYGMNINPNSEEKVHNFDEGFELIYSELWEKFMKGQCKLWLNSHRNVSDLGKLRGVLSDKTRAKKVYEGIYNQI